MSEDNSGDFEGNSADSVENNNNNKINSDKNKDENNKSNDDNQEEEFQIENNEMPDEPKKSENDSGVEMKNKNINIENEKEKKDVINLNSGNINNNYSSFQSKRKKDVIIMEIDEEKSKDFIVYKLIEVKNSSNLYLDDSNYKGKDNKKSILCFRRYSDFDKFYNTLKIRFPQCVFPRLSEKKILNNTEKKNLEIRRKELQYFINKLYYHEQISKSEEFKHFINVTFDPQYYDNFPMKYYYPECDKIKNDKGYISKGLNKLKGLFSNKKDNNQSDNEKIILDRQKEFDNKVIKYNELLIHLKNLYESAEETKEKYKNISNNFVFIKGKNEGDNENEEDDGKAIFDELIDLNENFSSIYDNGDNKLLMDIIDQLIFCIRDVEGVKRAIERYKHFVDDFKKIQNIKSDNNYVLMEKSKIKDDKEEFERELLKGLKKYDEENENIYEQIIERLTFYIKKINEDELEIFKNSSFN